MIKFDRRILTHFDYFQPIFILPIIILSHILIAEANQILASKQYVYFLVGFLSYLFFFVFPMRKFDFFIPFVYWVSIILLASVDIFGVIKFGAQRWLEIPFTHFTIQPSEIMKPSFVLMFAYMIKQNPPPESGYGLKNFLKLNFYILLPFFLILKEPDLGTALVLLITGYAVLFIVGVNKKIWLSIILIIGISGPILYENLHDYQKKRIEDFVSKEHGWQVKQALVAIGNGGMWGNKEATQTHNDFLPFATSDFIFPYTIERYGFAAGIFLLSFYGFLIIHFLTMLYRLKDDYMSQVFCISIAALIFVYVSVNVSMTMGFAPVVGIPLPFYSYGGSSFITFMCFLGIAQNLITFRFDPMFSFFKSKL